MPLTLASAPAPWSLRIFEVVDRDRQEHVLRTFLARSRPGVLALGTESDRGTFVIVDSAAGATERWVEDEVRTIDPTARCVYRSCPRLAARDGRR